MTKLYHDLRLNQYITYRERELENQLAFLRETVQPMNEMHNQLAKKAIRRLKWSVESSSCLFAIKQNLSFRLQWTILATMSFQTGVLFRLVWIDYRY